MDKGTCAQVLFGERCSGVNVCGASLMHMCVVEDVCDFGS